MGSNKGAKINLPTPPPQAHRTGYLRNTCGSDIPLDTFYHMCPAAESQNFPLACAERNPSAPRPSSRCFCLRVINESGSYAISLTVISVAGSALLSITQDGTMMGARGTQAVSIMLFSALSTSFLGLRAAHERTSKDQITLEDVGDGSHSNNGSDASQESNVTNRFLGPVVLGHLSIMLLLGSMLLSILLSLGIMVALTSISIFAALLVLYFAPQARNSLMRFRRDLRRDRL